MQILALVFNLRRHISGGFLLDSAVHGEDDSPCSESCDFLESIVTIPTFEQVGIIMRIENDGTLEDLKKKCIDSL